GMKRRGDSRSSFFRNLRRVFQPAGRGGRCRQLQASGLRVEALEHRLAPATLQIGPGAAGVTAHPGDAVVFDVRITANAHQVFGAGLGIFYDDTLLAIQGGADGAFGNDVVNESGWEGVCNVVSGPSEVLISLSNAVPFSSPTATVVQLTFHVLPAAPAG